MTALEEHVEKYKTTEEVEKHAAEVKVTMKHFEAALAKIKPSSQEEKKLSERIA